MWGKVEWEPGRRILRLKEILYTSLTCFVFLGLEERLPERAFANLNQAERTQGCQNPQRIVELVEYASQWYMPHVASHQHPADAHEESHEHIDRIVVKQSETVLNSATWLVAHLVHRHS